MRLKVIGSNSAGNGYILEAKAETLLIECGLPLKKIKEALDFKINNVSAIVSHCHGDHSKSIADVMKAGINVYASAATFSAKNVTGHHRAKVMEAGQYYTIGGFRIRPFEVNHDVPCFGFMISHEEMGLCVFLTDTCYSDNTFPSTVNHYIIECNHDLDIINANGTAKFLKDRIIGSHMNLETCRNLLLANNLTNVNNVVLIHLSNTNSDAIRFKKDIQAISGKLVHIAQAGLIIENFNKQPF